MVFFWQQVNLVVNQRQCLLFDPLYHSVGEEGGHYSSPWCTQPKILGKFVRNKLFVLFKLPCQSCEKLRLILMSYWWQKGSKPPTLHVSGSDSSVWTFLLLIPPLSFIFIFLFCTWEKQKGKDERTIISCTLSSRWWVMYGYCICNTHHGESLRRVGENLTFGQLARLVVDTFLLPKFYEKWLFKTYFEVYFWEMECVL